MTYREFEALLIGKLLVRGVHPGAIIVDRKMARWLFPLAYDFHKPQLSRHPTTGTVRITTLRPDTAIWVDKELTAPHLALWYPGIPGWEKVNLDEEANQILHSEES